MRNVYRFVALTLLIGISQLGASAPHPPQPGFVETDLVVNQEVNGVPTLTDSNGIVHIAAFFDPNLVNPWGVGESGGSPFWVSDNGNGTSSLYNTPGTPQPLVVSIPTPANRTGADGAPTGLVFNIASGQFPITGVTATGDPITAGSVFLFDTEDGTILGWNPNVNPPGFPAGTAGKHAIIAVNNSANPDACNHAIYKGLAIATDSVSGNTYLYAANFRAGTVEVYDSMFHSVDFGPNAFVDPKLPHRYAPFNVVPITMNGTTRLFVTYAMQDKAKEDDVKGAGHGIVDVYDLTGNMLMRFAQHQELNSPWGVTLTPAGFGQFEGDLLIGNFGDGRINVFDPATGGFLGNLKKPDDGPIVIDGLWTLMFGNGGNGGDQHKLYFTAGPNDEADGLFGSISPQP